MSEYIGRFDDARLEFDEDGCRLFIDGDEDAVSFWLSPENAVALVAALQPLVEHHEEGERERATYMRATPAERRAVLGPALGDDGAEIDYAEQLRDCADLDRKARRERA
jgi:hypothetical protein